MAHAGMVAQFEPELAFEGISAEVRRLSRAPDLVASAAQAAGHLPIWPRPATRYAAAIGRRTLAAPACIEVAPMPVPTKGDLHDDNLDGSTPVVHR